MTRMRSATLFIILIFLITSCAPSTQSNFVAPSLLPHVTQPMKTSGFWISRHPFPDRVILAPEEIVNFNRQIEDSKLTYDLLSWPSETKGDELKKILEETVKGLELRWLWNAQGRRAPAKFFAAVKRDMNFEGIQPAVQRQYGLTTHYADQRFIPTKEGLYAKAFDVDFDELQNSALDVGTPVIVLHSSLGGKWYYAQSSFSEGWIEADKVALCDSKEVHKFLSPSAFIVTTSAKADIFLDSNMTERHDYVQMGTRLPLVSKKNNRYEIQVPLRNNEGRCEIHKGFVSEADAVQDYLEYTPRHILHQAFKLLNSPYGWGGMYGEQDCSRFLQEVFATVGIHLPRDSKNQIKVGNILSQFKSADNDMKKMVLKQATGGITLLGLKGHIMLYLGLVDGEPFAIHSVWAYRQSNGREDKIYVLNRVVVSDLSLGEGSEKGSLLDRIISINTIGVK